MKAAQLLFTCTEGKQTRRISPSVDTQALHRIHYMMQLADTHGLKNMRWVKKVVGSVGGQSLRTKKQKDAYGNRLMGAL